MDMELKDRFTSLWKKYFPEAELPIAFWYSENAEGTEKVHIPKEHRCFLTDLAAVRQGKSLRFDGYTIGCEGGKKYCGFSDKLRPDFEYFLSCGIPGKVEGERYKKTPGLVKEFLKQDQQFEAPEQYLVFKRFDQLGWGEQPSAMIFIAPPDIIAGLFTLANFSESDVNGVISPFCAGCGSIVKYPFLENTSESPRGVLGMFDISARPFVGRNELSFSVPMKKFVSMVGDMEESFLTTRSWSIVQRRIEMAAKRGG
jgi:hypothetical protein